MDDTVPLDDLSVDPESTIVSVTDDGDGGVTIEIGKPAEPDVPGIDSDHNDNLALVLDEDVLANLGNDLIEKIEADKNSRAGWLEARSEAIAMLGIDVRRPDGSGNASGGISVVTHPMLIENVIRFQANARAELLPTDGPVKVRDDTRAPPAGTPADPTAIPSSDLAEALETDMNHYLTTTATEYIPSTDQMLFWLGLGGTEFKKVYADPVRRRPVSEWADATDIIVNNNATCGDIANAGRVTQQVRMRPAMVKRMQLAGAYRDDIDLYDTGSVDGQDNPVEQAIESQQGVSRVYAIDDDDRERILYECYCELDLPGFEHKHGRDYTGLPLPYKVVIDEETRTILEIRRNWREGDESYKAKQVFVPFIYVPGPGFYGLGLFHIIGNMANSATAALRIGLDAEMLANFPGGLISEDATRQDKVTLIGRIGEFLKVKTGGTPIRDAIMAFPYKGMSQGLNVLLDAISALGARIGGTAEIQVGEGAQNAPVGSTLALLEQAKVPENAVHKRLFAAQSQEFDLLVQLFREDPEAFWRGNKRPAAPWDEKLLLAALDNHDLVPMADPNTSSHVQRMSRVSFVLQTAQVAPQLFNLPQTLQWALREAKVPNGDALINMNPQAPAADPSKAIAAQAALVNAQANAAKVQVGAQTAVSGHQSSLAIAQLKSQDNARSLADQAADRASKEKLAVLDAQADALKHEHEQKQAIAAQAMGHRADIVSQMHGQAHEAGLAALGHQHALGQSMRKVQHDAALATLKHAHARQADHFARGGEVEREMLHKVADQEHERQMQERQHEQELERIRAQPKPNGGDN